MRKLVIGFSTPKKFALASFLIRLFQRSKYSHIYIKMLPSRRSPLPFDKVFQASHGDVNALKYNNFTELNKIVHEYTLEVSDEKYYEVANFLWEQLGKPYGFTQLLSIAFKRNKHKNESKAFICSELAGIVLRDFLGYDINKDQDLISLNDIKGYLENIG